MSGHQNIVQFVAASLINRTLNMERKLAEYILVTELCKAGQLRDCLDQALEPDIVLRVFYQACKAVQHLHRQNPPVSHRDIKIENFLIGTDEQLKLCDFGSATTTFYEPDFTWSAQQRDILIDSVSLSL